MLYPNDDLQIRLYSNTLCNDLYSPHNMMYSSVPTGFTCNLIAKVTRLPSQLNSYYINQINRKVQHYKFNELRYGTYNITATSNTRSTLVSNQITDMLFGFSLLFETLQI